jgi:hypothetical protein
MEKQSLFSAIGMLLIVLTISSCSKNALDFDPLQADLKNRDFKRGTVDLQHADNVYGLCRIRQTINQRSIYETMTRDFQYDKDNNPVSVTTKSPGTSQPNLYFKYDKKGNLIEYAGLYSGGTSFEFMHHYGYVDNKVVVDTMYVFGDYPTPTWYYSKRLRYLTYDHLDRVVSDSEVYVHPAPFTQVIKYNYDANGNLIRYGASYDSKMSPQRTNKIWMFVDRNYSMNNMVAASSYTTSGLPLKLSSSEPFSTLMTFAYFWYYNSTDIVYDCIEHGKKYPPSKFD